MNRRAAYAFLLRRRQLLYWVGVMLLVNHFFNTWILGYQTFFTLFIPGLSVVCGLNVVSALELRRAQKEFADYQRRLGEVEQMIKGRSKCRTCDVTFDDIREADAHLKRTGHSGLKPADK